MPLACGPWWMWCRGHVFKSPWNPVVEQSDWREKGTAAGRRVSSGCDPW
jgi:hypothetical protein